MRCVAYSAKAIWPASRAMSRIWPVMEEKMPSVVRGVLGCGGVRRVVRLGLRLRGEHAVDVCVERLDLGLDVDRVAGLVDHLRPLGEQRGGLAAQHLGHRRADLP